MATSDLAKKMEADLAPSASPLPRAVGPMTPRERVLRAVNHQLPDRVPIDLGGTKASGIAVVAYENVKRKLGISTPTRVLDPRFMIAVVEDEVLRRLHVDVVPFGGDRGQTYALYFALFLRSCRASHSTKRKSDPG